MSVIETAVRVIDVTVTARLLVSVVNAIEIANRKTPM
jgi:hypothetical protein